VELLICLGIMMTAVTAVIVLVAVIGSTKTGLEFNEKMEQLRRQQDGR
jgi:hypothetical protein